MAVSAAWSASPTGESSAFHVTVPAFPKKGRAASPPSRAAAVATSSSRSHITANPVDTRRRACYTRAHAPLCPARARLLAPLHERRNLARRLQRQEGRRAALLLLRLGRDLNAGAHRPRRGRARDRATR